MRVEAAFALVDALDGAEPPRPEQRRDACGPRPLTHSVEPLPILDLVAIDELLVRQEIAVRMHDPLRKPCRARRVIELGGIVCRRVGRHVLGGLLGKEIGGEDEDRHPAGAEPPRVRLVGDEHDGFRVTQPVCDPVVPVQDGHGEE